MQYSIPECNIESLEKKLIRIKNKCAKYDCNFHYERIGEHFEEKTFYEYDYDSVDAFGTPASKKWKEIVKYIDIEVEGNAAVNGWKYAASLEYTTKGNIISGVADIEIPSKYYNCEPWCEHCKTMRDRRHSFIVFNEETGEFKQVGKSCLRDFTGGLSAEQAALHESFFKDIEEASEFNGIGGSGKTYFYVSEFMNYVAETIRIYGYCKRDGIGICTADRAEELYRNAHNMHITQSAEDRVYEAKSKGFNVDNIESVELAAKVCEWIVSNDRDDNYYHNLKVACSLVCGDYKVIGLLASAFPTYNRELEYEAERKAREAKEAAERARSTYMGKVGERIKFKIAEAVCVTSWETQWGTTRIYKFTDSEGRTATWKTSSWYDDDELIDHEIAGTIKELKEYRGVKQTELTRCKIEKKAIERKAAADEDFWEFI